MARLKANGTLRGMRRVGRMWKPLAVMLRTRTFRRGSTIAGMGLVLGFGASLACGVVTVASNSMANTFCPGDRLLIEKVSRVLAQTPRRGQIVVFRHPQRTLASRDLQIKRIIAIGGDSVRIMRGAVLLNGQPLRETYVRHLKYHDRGRDFWPKPMMSGSQEVVNVSPGSLVVLGDNRDESSDAREWGFLPERNITGRVLFRISTSPRSPAGECLTN